ncbi:MAG: alanyl-tRNA editing protein [Nitrososphaerota archaeon]|jgi:Ser-tRNA(Ala) deacylase AlaX|nr:alanyl-tRNA editing protein [Nitrososphaerota archaeon]
MTKLLYYEDQYLRETEATVQRIDGNKVLLDSTIFFPQTSTEPGDNGKIAGQRISGLKKEGKDVWHIMEKSPRFKVGDKVKLEIDWAKRLKDIKLHSALHLLAGPFDKLFNERAVAGAVKPDHSYLVFKHELSDEVITKAIQEANAVISKGVEISSYWDDKREGFRWCQINDYPAIPDGGLHVKNTKELGSMQLVEKINESGTQKIKIKIT